MKVTEEDVSYVAGLANLELTQAERDRMLHDLNQVFEYIDLLNQADTAGASPMISAGRASSSNHLREDETLPCLPHEAALRNAPQTDGLYFQVPKVIER